jgi:hypothetical protein
MMRLRMYPSGIAIVAMAAVAAASSLSGVVVGEESSAVIFSSRFLNSLDSASAAAGVGDFATTTTTTTTTNANGPLRMVENEITEENAYSSRGDGDDINSSHHQRRELSWWSIALQFGEFCCCLFLPSLAFREGVFSSSSSSSLGAYYTHTFNRLYTSSS